MALALPDGHILLSGHEHLLMLSSLGRRGAQADSSDRSSDHLPPPHAPSSCLSSLSCNLLLCPARLSLAAELTLVQRKWDWCFVRWCFSLFLSVVLNCRGKERSLKMVSRVRCLTQVPTAQQSLNISGKMFQEEGC